MFWNLEPLNYAETNEIWSNCHIIEQKVNEHFDSGNLGLLTSASGELFCWPTLKANLWKVKSKSLLENQQVTQFSQLKHGRGRLKTTWRRTVVNNAKALGKEKYKGFCEEPNKMAAVCRCIMLPSEVGLGLITDYKNIEQQALLRVNEQLNWKELKWGALSDAILRMKDLGFRLKQSLELKRIIGEGTLEYFGLYVGPNSWFLKDIKWKRAKKNFGNEIWWHWNNPRS